MSQVGALCIKDGIAKISKLSENGRGQITKLVIKGDLLGQRTLISDESANQTATALNDMEVCFI
ncbi:MAG TPA: cyclic nucleotide-binding domain-containing protein, partial [Gemmatimonadetes bacterium]|nr:cyclic nucleotide-binding domain-containing protein [Gemmatimonadota bacterium]